MELVLKYLKNIHKNIQKIDTEIKIIEK